jgi:tyrosinase
VASYTARPIHAAPFRDARRADLVFHGVEQAGPSFEARVFLNNPDADESTPQTAESGYAGSFHVYGYGEAAPPAIAEAKARQPEGGGPVAPIEKRLHADEAAARQALEGSDELTVTVVPIPADPGGTPPERPFEDVELVLDPPRAGA